MTPDDLDAARVAAQAILGYAEPDDDEAIVARALLSCLDRLDRYEQAWEGIALIDGRCQSLMCSRCQHIIERAADVPLGASDAS